MTHSEQKRDELLQRLKSTPGTSLDAKPYWVVHLAEIQVQTASDIETAMARLKRSMDLSAVIMIVLTLAILILTGVMVWKTP